LFIPLVGENIIYPFRGKLFLKKFLKVYIKNYTKKPPQLKGGLVMLPHWQAFMSLKWFNEVKYPEYLQNEVNYFINLPEMQRLIAKRRI